MSDASVSSTPANASTPTPGLALSPKVPVATKNRPTHTTSGGANYCPLPPQNKQSDLASTIGKHKHTSKQEGSHPIHYVIGYDFHSSFLSIFNQTSSTFLTTPSHLMFIFLMFPFLYVSSHMNRQQGYNSIGIVQVYQLLTSAVRPPHDLLDYQTPETTPSSSNHPTLHWNFLGCPLLLP